ncbi:M16 family metallopeptidase [Xylanibacter ruminicola]|uniref:M16 family metallopeptidase n=1 Tax=Xylanibacter ruminicola TaxID=839 RepID=UPI00048B845D|nr:M16 family metallopeptidase [Xylanibacter ruminicola]
MKKILSTILLTLIGTVAMMAQMQMPSIPVDPDVRIGKLDNGLTYYIRHNNWPENRAEFYIAQKVGSIQENDDQRGLAHFLEHMAFNGSKHFKGNELIRWCESVGINFGGDLNAYTSIDETVYNISNVPTTREGIIDSCLLILYDWADGLLLEQEEIEKERGVIHEEWRLRTSAFMRMLERDLPKLYPGSKYGHRMPIGLMEIIDNFERPFLQSYYEKWYRPDNQGIIVVGDVDVDQIEKKIKDMFSPIVLPENRTLVTKEPVPDNAEAIYVIDKDKEQRTNEVMIMMKHEVFPDSLKGTITYMLSDYLKDACILMLNDRLKEYAEKPESPFLSARAADGRYILSSTMDAFEIDLSPKDGQIEAAVTAALTEARRAAEFGFTATEYNRFKQNYTSQLEKQYSNKDKRYNSQFVNQCVQNFLNNTPMPSIDYIYTTMKQIIPMLPLQTVNALMKELILPTDSNLVVFSMNTEKEGNVYPTEDSMKKAVANARSAQIKAYVDNVKDEPLMTTMPKKGSIKKETKNDQFGYTELTLSNGAKVILKQTDFKKDQVLLRGEGFGGSALYGEKDFANIKMFDDVIEASGLGNFSHTELEKALAGKIASASISLGSNRQNVSGSSTPKDIETMLQLVYLYFTNIAKDQKSYDNLMQTTEVSLKNRLLQPEAVLQDSLTATLTCNNPRNKVLTTADLTKVSYDRILEMAKEQTANAAAFTFTIIGNYDESTIRPLIETYLASLPAKKKVVKSPKVSTLFKGVAINNFKQKAETPKAFAVMQWYSEDIPMTAENDIKIDMAGQILSMEYLKKIREDASAAYTVQAMAGIERNDFETIAQILAVCPMKPEKADTAIMILRDEVTAMAKTCDAEKLQKVKEYMLKSHGDQVKQNSYWLSIINGWRKYGIDFHSNYEKLVNAQTPESISALVKEVLKSGNRAEVIMLPAE